MFLRKRIVLIGACILLISGFLLGKCGKRPEPKPEKIEPVVPVPVPVPAAPAKPDLSVNEQFLQVMNLAEITEFDTLYEQRQTQLRDIMSKGSESAVVPPGLFAQIDHIQSKIDMLQNLPASTDGQTSVRQAFINAYQLLKETFEKEVEFLKSYPEKSQNISFITQNIFDISAKDQRSGFQYLEALLTYRKMLAEAIRADESPQKNQVRVKGLVTLNSLVEKYKTALNIPKETL